MPVLDVSGLPESPSAAAAAFHCDVLTQIKQRLDAGEGCLVLAFDGADYTHSGWRLAIVQTLAREHTPARINAISGGGAAARNAACAYLETAEGITGQYLVLDDAGAGLVVSSAT
ncbi:MAG: Rossmann fold domain-containing protein [Novosphingobium sp.]|uniref:Rossmann fold domain-containing protein n=1 Tax=Novosphingobium sp. TaxID=1874826 RepID=UPI0032BA0BE4